MTDRELLHEIEMSRAATDAIRRDVQNAKEKGYFSSTEFGRLFVSELTNDFAAALVESTAKPARGKATATNIARAFRTMQEVFSRCDEKIIAVIALKSILDSFGVCKFDKPRTAEASTFIGKRIEDEVRVGYYTQLAPDDVVAAQRKELNTSGSNPHFRQYGAKRVTEALLLEQGWSQDDLFPGWSIQLRGHVGLFILEVAKQKGYVSVQTKQIQKNKRQAFIDLSPALEAQFKIFQAELERYAFKDWALIEVPKDWEVQEGAARVNFSGGYYHEWIRRQRRLCRSFHSNTEFGREAIELLNILNRTAWNIDADVYDVAKGCLERGYTVGSLRALTRDPRLDQPMPEHIKDLPKDADERKAWKKEKAGLYKQYSDARKISIRSRDALTLATKFLKQPRFYLSWSCDYRGRMYSQQSLLHQQSTDVERGMVTFADGCKLDSRGEHWAALAVGSAFVGSKVSYTERSQWTKDNTQLIKAIADNPLGMTRQWEGCAEPWQFLQLALEWNRVVLNKDKHLWDVPIGADSTGSGLQLLSAMRRDEKGMIFSNLYPPVSASEPPRDAYLEVLRIARELAVNDADTQRFAEFLNKRELGKPILMKALYGASQQTNREDIKEYFRKEGLYPDTITFKDVCAITKLLRTASKHVFPSAFQALDWMTKLFNKAKANGSESLIWRTPNNDSIELIEFERETIDVRTSHLGKVRIGIGQTEHIDYPSMKKALAPSFVHSYDAAVLKSSFKDWSHPIALIHDCLKVLPNDMDRAMERVKKGFVHVCSGDPLARLADDLEVSAEQLPRLKQGTGNLLAALDSQYMFN